MWTEDEDKRLMEGVTREWSGEKMDTDGWGRVATALRKRHAGGERTAGACNHRWRKLSGKFYLKELPGKYKGSVREAILESYAEQDQPSREQILQLQVDLRALGADIDFVSLRNIFGEMRRVDKPSQDDFREMAAEINEEAEDEGSHIVTIHRCVKLVLNPRGYQGVNFTGGRYRAQFFSGGKNQVWRFESELDASLLYSLKYYDRVRDLTAKEAELLVELEALAKEKKAKPVGKKPKKESDTKVELEARGLGTPHTQTGKRRRS